MNYKMNLYSDPFQSILLGNKIIEVRLYDEKRKKLNVGDTIEFKEITTGSVVTKKVVELIVKDNFYSLFKNYPLEYFGSKKDEDINIMVESMYKYYTRENEEKYGVLGIRLK